MHRIGALVLVAVAGAFALSTENIGAQATPAPAKPSTEWPTYGHDSGGMRFSPLTQINASNVGQLQEAWVYHMRPPQEPKTPPTAADGEAGGRAGAAAGAGAAAAGAQGGARGRGRGRGGSGFSTSETTPIVVDGVMYITAPYGRVVALDPTTGKEIWVFAQPQGNPSTRGVEYWAGDSKTAPQIVFGWSNGRLYSLHAKTGEPNEAFGEKAAST
jgi:quinoprotein glucose dehydrogenase